MWKVPRGKVWKTFLMSDKQMLHGWAVEHLCLVAGRVLGWGAFGGGELSHRGMVVVEGQEPSPLNPDESNYHFGLDAELVNK